MGNKILSFLSGHLIDIGLEVSRDKIKDAIKKNKHAKESQISLRGRQNTIFHVLLRKKLILVP